MHTLNTRPPLSRRQVVSGLVLLAGTGWVGRKADAVPASLPSRPMSPAAILSAQVALDGVYIPALFLTGAAPKSPEGPERAAAAMERLVASWPALRADLVAAYPRDAGWRTALDRVQRLIQTANVEVARQAWGASHETLEAVRETLFEARAARGLAYLLDDCTRFHRAMEKLAAAAAAPGLLARETLAADFAAARALWRVIERKPLEAASLGLSPARLQQWQQGAAAEGEALARLSDALHQGDERAWRQAAAATKAPFVRAYTAFGWPQGESPRLPN